MSAIKRAAQGGCVKAELLATCSGGIIMSAESVIATRDARKTQTRRVIPAWAVDRAGSNVGGLDPVPGQRYHEGKRYYVKEAIKLTQSDRPDYDRAEYEADGAVTKLDTWPWKRYRLSAMVMPRGLARYVIEVDNVRVQRLQDITEDDARAEGLDEWVPCNCITGIKGVRVGGAKRQATCREHFANSWDAINGKRAPWASNPWVFAYSYHLVTA